MTDRFEEAVRQAAQGLESPGPVPSYESAWKRGRRRRVVKQAGMACAGALVLVAALTVNLGRGTGSDTSEVDEVVVGVDAATPVPEEQEPIATTPPVPTPSTIPDTRSATASATEVFPTAVPSTVEESAVVPTATAVPSGDATATAPLPLPTTPVAPAATAVPVVPPAPTPFPEPTVESAASTAAPTPEPTAVAAETVETATPEPSDTSDSSATQTVPVNPTSEPETAAAPEVAATDPARATSADATLADPSTATSLATDGGIPCDTNGDGRSDATCELLGPYACKTEADLVAGYQVFDTDDDGAIDMCIAVDLTSCDTTGDGLGDTPCIIELTPTEE